MSAGIERFVPKEHREVKGGYRFRNIIRPAIQATKRYVIIFATDFIIKQSDKSRYYCPDRTGDRNRKVGSDNCSRGIHGECQGVDDRRERGVPARVRKFHPQTEGGEKGS